MSIWVGSSILKAHSLLIPILYFNIDLVNFLPQKAEGRREIINLDTGENTLKMQFYYLKTGDVITAVM